MAHVCDDPDCDACNQSAEELRNQSEALLDEYGWLAHNVSDDPQSPTGFNYHTHGVADLGKAVEALDIQIVYPLPGQLAHSLASELIDRIREGERFNVGVPISKIVRDFDVMLAYAEESGRTVWRMILPGPDGKLQKSEMTEPVAVQWKGTKASRY